MRFQIFQGEATSALSETSGFISSRRDLIGDPFHSRATKKSGATTRVAARRISAVCGLDGWHDPACQHEIVGMIKDRAQAAGRFGVGPAAFAWLAEADDERR